MLLEMLFCTGFFVLPLIGMFVMVIAQVIKASKEAYAEGEEETPTFPLRKRVRAYTIPVFEHSKVLDYQLVETQTHRVGYIHHFKKGANPRAGP